jgi:hypothetical protein
MTDWRKTELWRRRGTNFLIEVSHRSEDVRSEDVRQEYEDGGNRWCLYVYVYPLHPHFKEMMKSGYDGDDLPLHCGPSLFAKHSRDQEVTSIQVGCDYNHYGDAAYTYMDTAELAAGVFFDAEKLFEHMSKGKEGEA